MARAKHSIFGFGNQLFLARPSWSIYDMEARLAIGRAMHNVPEDGAQGEATLHRVDEPNGSLALRPYKRIPKGPTEWNC